MLSKCLEMYDIICMLCILFAKLQIVISFAVHCSSVRLGRETHPLPLGNGQYILPYSLRYSCDVNHLFSLVI